jgi:hypothetical protein
MPGMNPTQGVRYGRGQLSLILLEEQPQSWIVVILHAKEHLRVPPNGHQTTFELTNYSTSVDVIDIGQAHPLGNHAERNTMRLLACVGTMTCLMQMQYQTVLTGLFSHRLDCRVADG